MAEASFPTSACSYFRQLYYEGLDLIISCIKNHFEQHGYMVYRHLQDVLLNAARHTDYSGDFTLSQFCMVQILILKD